MLVKNEIYETEITSYSSDGSGICRIDGIAVFVPFTVAGDKLLVRIVKTCKTYAYGKIEKLLLPSENRATPLCPVFGKCGGCSLMQMTYEEQLRFKHTYVSDCIKRLGGIAAEVLPPLKSDKIYGYRNKVQIPVGISAEGKVITGFYSQRSHRVIQCEGCLIQNEISQKITKIFCDWMEEFNILPYCEETHSGLFRHIYVRCGEGTDEIMAVAVINSKTLPHGEIIAERLKSAGVTSFSYNINREKTNVILGNKTVNIYGGEKIKDTLCGLTFEISPESFYQVNHSQAERLYETAIRFADITKEDCVLDLYCGTGTITLCAAVYAKKAVGIEIVPEAIRDAKENMRLNDINNAEFYLGDAAEVTAKLSKEGVKADKIIVDPPRKGCSPETLKLISRLSPKTVVYISCNPATLARDLKLMKEYGYDTEMVQPVDMFVHSSHVECVALLTLSEYGCRGKSVHK